MIERKVVYFEHAGEENTLNTLKIAKERADELGIKEIIVASTTGYTAKEAVKIFDPNKYKLIIVTHMTGFIEPGFQEFPDELRKELEK
ncbi:MAG: hypothetical protein DRO36_06925, partial [Candidatus Hecatellales archaeon]